MTLDMGARRMIAALVLATVSSVFPGFLIGALSVQVSAEFEVSEALYGWGLGSFFLAAATGSILLGRLVQRIGPRRQIMTALTVTSLANLGIAMADSFGQIIVGLAVCGLMNAGNQTAVNLALTRAGISRLGLAVAIKQAGMPTASVLSGFAVPALALTVGWRWGFVMGTATALIALLGVWMEVPAVSATPRAEHSPVISSRRSLRLAAVGVGLLAFSTGALGSWTVASGVDAGLSPGLAGAVLSVGAGLGIGLRLLSGWRLDTMASRPFAIAGATAAIGAVGIGLTALRVPATHMMATVMAVSCGWVWPVFTNFAIVRTNADAAGTATGVTQMGVYVGVFIAPLLTGTLIEAAGYGVMWSVVAVVTAAGALTVARVADEF